MILWFIPILIAIALSAVSVLLMPKPKTARPEAAKDLDSPTSEAGRPIPVIFGRVTIKGGNVLATADKASRTYQVSV